MNLSHFDSWSPPNMRRRHTLGSPSNHCEPIVTSFSNLYLRHERSPTASLGYNGHSPMDTSDSYKQLNHGDPIPMDHNHSPMDTNYIVTRWMPDDIASYYTGNDSVVSLESTRDCNENYHRRTTTFTMFPHKNRSLHGPPVSTLVDAPPTCQPSGVVDWSEKSSDVVPPLKFTPGRKLNVHPHNVDKVICYSDDLNISGCSLTFQGNTKKNMSPQKLLNDLICESPPSRMSLRRLCSYLIALSIIIIATFVLMSQIFKEIWYVCPFHLNITELSADLHHQVYGQHLAVDIIPEAIEKFMLGSRHNSTLLVLAFHGWIGIGKTFVSSIIAKHFHSSTVSTIIMPLHFPQSSPFDADTIQQMIMSKVKPGKLQLIILDEMDKAPLGVIMGLQSVFDIIQHNSTYNMSRTIILTLSNNRGSNIGSYVYESLQAGRKRESIRQDELQTVLLEKCDISHEWHCALMSSVDCFVPFLPLQRSHVKQCIMSDAEVKHFDLNDAEVEVVADELQYFPSNSPTFSATGCRAVTSKVDLIYVN